jgi:hypothetical protein
MKIYQRNWESFMIRIILIASLVMAIFWLFFTVFMAIEVFGEPRELKAMWEPNPETDNVLGYQIYWRYDKHIPEQIDYKNKPNSFTEPYGIYIWQDNDDLEWHLWTSYAPEGNKHNYKGTKIIPVGGRIEVAEFYQPEELETIKWDAAGILVENMSVNGTGGIDGIDFWTDAHDLEFQIIFSGSIAPENILIGKNLIKPNVLSFSLGEGRGYSKERIINQSGLIPPESYSEYVFTFDPGAETNIYFVLTAINQIGESGFSNEAMIDFTMPEPIPPDKEKPSSPIEFKIIRQP